MARTTPPTIETIPAEIHADAFSLGLMVETHTDTVAGHGITGRVGWSVFTTRADGYGFTDAVRMRYGTSRDSVMARAELRDALASIRAQREGVNE